MEQVKKTWWVLFCALFLLLPSFAGMLHATERQTVRVGMYEGGQTTDVNNQDKENGEDA